MATKREGSARKRRPVRKSAAKKATNSKIAEAQAAAQAKQKASQDTLRGMSAAATAKPTSPAGEGSLGGPLKKGPTGPVAPSPGLGGKAVYKNPNYQPTYESPLQAQAKLDMLSDPKAFVGLYGGPPKDRAKRITDNITATNEAATALAKSKGQAVWMGPVAGKVKTRVVGDMPDERGADTYLKTSGEQILTKSVLMSWLTDPTKVDQIMKVAQSAGLAVENYEDVSKLWGSVVDQAGDSYSLTGKKVTPWSLIQLRGKYAVAGKPADRVTTTTNIDEMSPAQARLMFEQTAQQQLGRAPTKAEVDDFIAKAQTIAKENPTVTKTTQKIGFDGNVTDTTNVTTGQGEAQAASQLASMDAAKQTEDYAAYQAAGNYFPSLFEALQSPV